MSESLLWIFVIAGAAVLVLALGLWWRKRQEKRRKGGYDIYPLW
jgi:LPXTG-motif cell wall-anchored protein